MALYITNEETSFLYWQIVESCELSDTFLQNSYKYASFRLSVYSIMWFIFNVSIQPTMPELSNISEDKKEYFYVI